MAEPDSWEDLDGGSGAGAGGTPPNPQHQAGPGLGAMNPNAPTFAFNPTASTFAPAYGAPGYGGYGYPQQYVYGQYGNQGYSAGAPPGYMMTPQGPVPVGYYQQQPQQQQVNWQQQQPQQQYAPRQQYQQGGRGRGGGRGTNNQGGGRHGGGYQDRGGGVQQGGGGPQAPAGAAAASVSASVSASVLATETKKAAEAVPKEKPQQKPAAPTEKPRQAVQIALGGPPQKAPAAPEPKVEAAAETNAVVPAETTADPEAAAEKLSTLAINGDGKAEAQGEAAEAAKKAAELPKDLPTSSPESVPAAGPTPASAPMEEAEEEEDIVIPEGGDQRDHLNLVFIGHVDAGKSTIGGQILFLADMVDKRTIEKYEREAKDKNRESWYMAYIMDTNEEERAKGKTVEVGRAHFETAKKRYTILDAPGHKNYVPNMISGASQADVGVLVIAARKGEFETGFERGGQTREHAQLAKTLGVSKLLVVVNKMDDPSVEWGKERFDDIVSKMTPFLKSCGYNTKKDVHFLPISGLKGINMKDRVPKSVCPWWDGTCLFAALDNLESPDRDPKAPFRMPLIDKYSDMGTVVMGKIESGIVKRGDNLLLMPNKTPVKVVTLYRDNDEVAFAKPGENLRIRLSGVEEKDVTPGFVLCSKKRPIQAVLEFEAQLQVLELLDHKAIFTAGYKAVLHLHALVEECEVMELLQQIDPKTRKPMKKKPLFVKSNAVVVVRLQVEELICVEAFKDFPQLGRFTLRDEGKTVAIGKVTKLIMGGTPATA